MKKTSVIATLITTLAAATMLGLIALTLFALLMGDGFHQAAKECQQLENKQACAACAFKLVSKRPVSLADNPRNLVETIERQENRLAFERWASAKYICGVQPRS